MSKPYGQLFWDRLDRYPPILCRLLARIPRGRPLTLDEICDRSKLSPSEVHAISRQLDWRGIDLPTARAFMVACGTDLSNRDHCRRIRMFLKSQPSQPLRRFAYLRRDRLQWETIYLPLMKRLLEKWNDKPKA